MSDYADDLDSDDLLSSGPTDSQHQQVVALARKQVRLEREVTQLEAALKTKQEELAGIAERELPALLTDLGVKNYTLTNGVVVGIKEKIVASIRAEDRPEAFTWFHKAGYGAIVKRTVKVELPAGMSKKATSLIGYLRRWYKDYRVSDEENVHASTLNAWAREVHKANLAALTDDGELVELPDVIKLTELKTSIVVVPKHLTDI